MLILGIGLVCVHKPNALCDECHDWKMKCKYPGKTSIGVGSGTGVGSPTKGQPVVMVPSPKCKSLEVQCQEVVVGEWVNELAEACLKVDCDMVCTMHDLAHAMGCTNVGVLSVAGAGAPGGAWGVGWSAKHEEGGSKGKGKGKERGGVEDEGVGEGRGWGGYGGGSDGWTEGRGDRHDDGGDEDGCDDGAPVMEYIG